jgi:hypothetical protein
MRRRSLLAAGPPALAACGWFDREYFARTEALDGERLVYVIGTEATTLDPTKSAELWQRRVVQAMFDGPTALPPTAAEPMAALATHPKWPAAALYYSLCRRGHGRHRSQRLSNTSTLALTTERDGSEKTSPADVPRHRTIRGAHWSDER